MRCTTGLLARSSFNGVQPVRAWLASSTRAAHVCVQASHNAASSSSASEYAGSFASSAYQEKRAKMMSVLHQLTDIGVASTLALPAIAVCGNQSAGKSSLMERLCGVSLPRASGTCTRCPTEIRMSMARTPDQPWACKIKLRHSHDASGQPLQETSHTVFAKLEGDAGKRSLATHISQAQTALLNPSAKITSNVNSSGSSSGNELPFTRNVVVLEITGADVDLTLVDLPGIIQSSADMDKSSIDLIRSMVNEYIKSDRTVIVQAITMKDDIHNQAIFDMAKEVDPEGKRTIGILTKPDTIEAGTHATWLRILRDEQCKLRLGYYVVRNPSQADLDMGISQPEASQLEAAFFSSTAPWNSLNLTEKQRLGVTSVRNALSQQLVSLTEQELPGIKDQVAAKAKAVAEHLAALPQRLDGGDAATQLHMLARQFSTVLRRAEDDQDESEFCRHVQGSFRGFAEQLMQDQPAFYMGSSADAPSAAAVTTFSYSSADGECSDQSELTMAEVDELVKRHHSYHHLPGTVPSSVLKALIKEFKPDWDDFTTQCLTAVSDRLVEEWTAHASDIYSNHPGAHKAVMGVLYDLHEATLNTTQQKLGKLLAMEDFNLTMNTHAYIRSKRAYVSKMETASADHPHVELVADMFAYLKVVTQRIMDMVPLHIRYHLLASFVAHVDNQLMVKLMQGGSTDEENLQQLMQEEQGLAQRRVQLQALDKQLKEAQRILALF